MFLKPTQTHHWSQTFTCGHHFNRKFFNKMNTELCKTNECQPANTINYQKPRYSVIDHNDFYQVRVDVPGVNKDGVSITHEGDTLLIKATRNAANRSDWKLLREENRELDYQLKLQLNVDVDGEKISAKTENGILTVTLPIAEAAKPRTISVE